MSPCYRIQSRDFDRRGRKSAELLVLGCHAGMPARQMKTSTLARAARHQLTVDPVTVGWTSCPFRLSKIPGASWNWPLVLPCIAES